MAELDLFGNVVEKTETLKERFGENPFTILDTKTGSWQNRKRRWIKLGIQSEVGRNANAYKLKNG